MAIIQRGKRFRVYWQNPYTHKRESFSVASLEEAKKQDALIKYRLQFERETFLQEPQEEAVLSIQESTLEEVYLAYLKEKRFNKKSLSWQIYAMRDALQTLGTLPIKSITYQQLCTLKNDIIELVPTQATARNKLSVLRTVLRWAYDREYLDTPLRFPKLPSADYEHFVPPSRQELEQMYAVAPEHIQRVIVLGSQFGIRIGTCELFKLQWSDIDIFKKVVRVPSAKKNHNETYREVPIRESLLRLICQWKQQDEQKGIVYVINWQGKQVNSIRHSWAYTLRQAGINRRIRPYDLRHAFATEAINAGADAGTVAKLMGHTSTTMIFKHYQHVLTEQKVRVVESLPNITNVPLTMCQSK